MSALRLSASEAVERSGGAVGVVGRVLGDVPKRPKNLSESFSYIYLSQFRADTFIGGGLPACNMAQETITPEAQTPTTLVVEETVVFPALEAIAKKVSKTSADDARTILGEDSVTDFAFNGTLTVGSQTAIIDETGTIEIGASHVRSQTGKVPSNAKDLVFYSLLGALRPAAQKLVLDAVEGRMNGTMSNDEAGAQILAGFNLSPEAMSAGKKALAERRLATKQTVKAPVKVHLDA